MHFRLKTRRNRAPRFYVPASLWLGARSGEVFSFWGLPAVGESVEVPRKLKTRLLMLLEDQRSPRMLTDFLALLSTGELGRTQAGDDISASFLSTRASHRSPVELFFNPADSGGPGQTAAGKEGQRGTQQFL